MPDKINLRQAHHPSFVVHHPPLPQDVDKPSVILYGSIEKLDWREDFAASLSDLPVIVLNPNRADWDSTWVEDISCSKFKEQVEWEMDYAQVADVIAFHFGSATAAPISLLELGMYAGTGKVVVHCDPGYPKLGNVQIVCAKYAIPMVSEMDELKELVRTRLQEKLK